MVHARLWLALFRCFFLPAKGTDFFKDTTIKSINQERFGRWAAILYGKSPKEEKKHLPNEEKSSIFLPRKDRSSVRIKGGRKRKGSGNIKIRNFGEGRKNFLRRDCKACPPFGR